MLTRPTGVSLHYYPGVKQFVVQRFSRSQGERLVLRDRLFDELRIGGQRQRPRNIDKMSYNYTAWRLLPIFTSCNGLRIGEPLSGQNTYFPVMFFSVLHRASFYVRRYLGVGKINRLWRD